MQVNLAIGSEHRQCQKSVTRDNQEREVQRATLRRSMPFSYPRI